MKLFMYKKRLFKRLFKKDFEVMEQQQATIKALVERVSSLEKLLEKKETELIKEYNRPISQEDVVKWCVKTLGMTFIDFANIDEDGKPPHYLDKLTPEERKNWVAHLETLYQDEKLQAVIAYVINLIGNHAIQKADDEHMRNGKIAIIGIRTFMGEIMQAHQEYLDIRKPTEEFDPLAVMPE